MHRTAHNALVRTSGVVATSVLALGLATACSSSKPHSETSTATGSTPAKPATSASSSSDYSRLLISPADIPVAGVTRESAAAPPKGAGVSALFVDPSGTRKLGDTILVLADAASAKTAAAAAQQAAKATLTGATSAAANVGSDAMVYTGTTNGGSTASTVLVFAEGKAYAVLQFDSAANDPVPAALVEQVGTKQDQLIKSGLQ